MVYNAFQAVLMILIITAFGFFVGYKGWANEQVTSFITKLILNITFPCTTVYAFLNYFSADEMTSSWVYIVAALGATFAVYLLGKLIARLVKIKPGQRGVFVVLFSLSNTIFMGLPVATAIFGQAGIIYALFYYVANTIMLNSFGYLEIARDGMVLSGNVRRHGALGMVKRMMKPPLIAVIVAFVLVFLRVELPPFAMNTLMYTSNITSPLALIFLGIVLQRTGLSCIKRIDKPIAWSLVGKFIMCPLIMYITAAYVVHMDPFPTSVMVVQSGLPALVTCTLFAEDACADTELAARGVVISTLVSFISIPIYVTILGA